MKGSFLASPKPRPHYCIALSRSQFKLFGSLNPTTSIQTNSSRAPPMAAEAIEAQPVEILMEPENHQESIFSSRTLTSLAEISRSPGHLLLLQLWQRDEHLSGYRIGVQELHLDSLKREVFHLCCLFFAFHFFFLALLFTSSAWELRRGERCQRWWVPFSLSLITSVALVSAVQMKLFGVQRVKKLLQSERGCDRALTRYVQELRLKGASFDLSMEPQDASNMENTSVATQRWLVRWCLGNLITLGLAGVSMFLIPASRLLLCS